MDSLSIKDQIKKEFGIDLPILGGSGQSIDDPIIIDPNYKDWSDVEYTFIRLVNQVLNRPWKIVKSTLLEHDSRQIDQLKLEINGDNKNYHNYYFDVTSHL